MKNEIYKFFAINIVGPEKACSWSGCTERASRSWLKGVHCINDESFKRFWEHAMYHRRELVFSEPLEDHTYLAWTRPESFHKTGGWRALLFHNFDNTSRFLVVYERMGVIYGYDDTGFVPSYAMLDPEGHLKGIARDVYQRLTDYQEMYSYPSAS